MQGEFLLILLQIVMELLPISSSGHVLLLSKILSLSCQREIFEVFDHLSYITTILIVLVVFWPDWSGLFVRLIKFEWCRDSYKRLFSLVMRIVGYVCIVDLITIVGYFIFRVLLKDMAFMQSPTVLFFGFVLTAVGLLSLYLLPFRSNSATLDAKKSILIGFAQALALIPGVSRFASVYVVSRWLGISPRRSIQFLFLVFIPPMMALFLKGVGEAFESREILPVYSVYHMIAVILATIGGYVALRFACRWSLEKKFWRFGIYVACVSILVLFFF